MSKNFLLNSAISGAAWGILFSLSCAASASEVVPAAEIVEAEEALAILRHRPRLEALPGQQRQPLKTFSVSPESDVMGQVTGVSELKDVEPNAWAYEALRSLVERYGCIVGYPDGTFRGNRVLTRWEFAAGLNACLNTIERLLQENVAVLKEDLEKLKRLAAEFQQELAAFDTRIDNLESRVAFLEDHQFSTTTKLTGETIVAFSGVWGHETAALDEPKNSPITDGQITVNLRSRLMWDTSFNGEDRLRVRLQAANFYFARGGSNLTDFNFSGGGDLNLEINKLEYRFPATKQLTVWVSGAKLTLDDISDPLAPYTSSFTEGAVAFFPSFAPLYLINDYRGAGFGALYKFTDELNLGILYSANSSANPNQGNGLFNGSFTAGAQLTYAPTANTGIGLAYLRNYIPEGQFSEFALLTYTGVANTDNPFDDNATSSDNVGLVWSWQLSPGFNLSGWGMYTKAYAEGGIRGGDEADIWNWKVSFAFPDLFKEGNLGVISVGNPPYAANLTNRNGVPTPIVATEDAPWLIETFYVFQINDNISITPAIWTAINPENGRTPLWVGAIRSSFKF